MPNRQLDQIDSECPFATPGTYDSHLILNPHQPPLVLQGAAQSLFAPLGPLPPCATSFWSLASVRAYWMRWKELGVGEEGSWGVTPLAPSCQVCVDGGWAPLPRVTAPARQLQGLVTPPSPCCFKLRMGSTPCLARPR